MPRYAVAAISHESAARARELAEHHRKPIGRLVDELIDRAYADTFGDPDADDLFVEDGPDGRTVGLLLPNVSRDATVSVPVAVNTVADALDRLARTSGSGTRLLDMDHPAAPVIEIRRRGTGIVVTGTVDGETGRRSYAPAAAQKLAAAIRRAAGE